MTGRTWVATMGASAAVGVAIVLSVTAVQDQPAPPAHQVDQQALLHLLIPTATPTPPPLPQEIVLQDYLRGVISVGHQG